MKIAPIIRELKRRGLPYKLIHTGQHYDYNMSKIFFEQLSLPEPNYYLGVGSGTHNFQIAKTMLELEKAYEEINPSLVIVAGDVNSTLAGALSAVKAGFPVAHVEAGLRSFDRTMPEEINRLLTDMVSDLLFTTYKDAGDNLLREGIAAEKVRFVGNTMIDTMLTLMEEIDNSHLPGKLGLEESTYLFITLHRPNNVDNHSTLAEIARAFEEVSETGLSMVFPLHPRTRHNMQNFGFLERFSAIPGLLLTEPVNYIDSIALARGSKAVLTDSGGLQEETTFLGIPCLTLRPNTERPATITEGTNTLLDEGPSTIPREVEKIIRGETKKGKVPPLWDGKAAERIAAIIESFL